MPGLIIHDGYTLSFTIPAQGAFPELSGLYRPALPDAVNHFRYAKRLTPKDETDAVVDILAKHVSAWSVKERVADLREAFGDAFTQRHFPGQQADAVVSVPCVEEVLRKIPAPHLVALLEYVTGYGDKQVRDDAKN